MVCGRARWGAVATGRADRRAGSVSDDTTTIDHWRERARNTRLVPLAAVRAGAKDMPDGAHTGRWARLYGRDVFLSCEVFRLANERAGTHIVRLEQAPVIIGQERFAGLGRDARVIEDRLEGEAREAFMAALRRTLIPARLAAMWARALGFQIPEEFYFSALFAGLGELMVRYLEPAQGRLVDEGLGKGHPWDGGEREVLGFRQRDLALALARDWDLPQLLLHVSPGSAEATGKAGVVGGALEAGALLGVPGDGERITVLLEALGERWDRSPQGLGEDLFSCARECSRDALEWYPRALDARFVELYPRLHIWRSVSPPARPGASSEVAAPRPPGPAAASVAGGPPGAEGDEAGPAAAKSPSAVAPRPPAKGNPPPGTGARLPASKPRPPPTGPRSTPAAAPETTSDVISRVVHQIVTGTPLERCLFLVMDRRKGVVVVRHHAGLAADSPLGRLSVGLGDRNLFALVMQKPTVLWVDAAKRRRFQGAISGPLRALSPAGEFLVASLFIKGRPLGLLYADGGSALSAAHLHNFKKAHGYLVRHLDELASRRLAQAGG